MQEKKINKVNKREKEIERTLEYIIIIIIINK